MADDTNRSILPVKDGSCIETCRSSIIDSRERHYVCKLDRYQLEDKCLRLLEDLHNLKKLSNCQEDKIKRLTTKLMRISASPRTCTSLIDTNIDKNKVSALELENTKLRDKITVLRNQLLNHKIFGRSPSRGRQRQQSGLYSGVTTCRSENGRIKTPSFPCNVSSENDEEMQTYRAKIQDLESQKKELLSRVAQLETELATGMIGNQREKVAENVEYIRVLRQMKQCDEKLIAAQNVNESLNSQIKDLKKLLEETSRNNKEIKAALMAEKERMLEMEVQMSKAKDSQLTLREKDEQIRDLSNEMKILQQHNNELIALSSKYSQVESENVELKKKISEQLSDHQSLKSAFSNEQANILALQAANEQLLTRLQEFQTNMDALNIQIMSRQREQYEKVTIGIQTTQDKSERNAIRSPVKCNEESKRRSEICKKCCERESENTASPKKRQNFDQGTQTEMQSEPARLMNNIDKGKDFRIESIEYNGNVNNGSGLTQEKMLKLLEQAQINMPLDTQKAMRMRKIHDDDEESSEPSSVGEILVRENIVISRGCKEYEHLELNCAENNNNSEILGNKMNANEILVTLYDVLRRYAYFHGTENESQRLCDQCTDIKLNTLFEKDTDIDNNICNKENLTVNQAKCDVNGNTIYKHEVEKNWQRDDCEVFNFCLCDGAKEYSKIRRDENKFYGKLCDENDSFCSKPNLKLNKNIVCCQLENDCKPRIQQKTPEKLISAKFKKNPQKVITNVTEEFVNDQRGSCMDKNGNTNSPMLLSNNEGLVEIHILSLQLSSLASHELSHEGCLKNASFCITWHLWGEGKAFTEAKQYPNLNYESSSVNRIPHLFEFFDNVLSEYMLFQVHVVKENNRNYVAGVAKLYIQDILNFPQNKLHYIVPVNSIIKCSAGQNLGQLSLWIRLSCDISKVMYFKSLHGKIFDQDNQFETDKPFSQIKRNSNREENKVAINLSKSFEKYGNSPESDQDKPKHERKRISWSDETSPVNSDIPIGPSFPVTTLKNSSNLPPTTEIDKNNKDNDDGREKNHKETKKPVPASQDPTAVEPKPETASVTEFKKVINNDVHVAYSQSSISDVRDVFTNQNWNFYRNKSIDSAKSRTSASQNHDVTDDHRSNLSISYLEKEEKHIIGIEIVSVKLQKNTSIMSNPEVHLLYVEYSFLGYRGVDMETNSLQKPRKSNETLYYNFKRYFRIDEDQHSLQRGILRDMLTEKLSPNIKFILVSEPLPNETEVKDCLDVGYAYFNLREYALSNGLSEVPLMIWCADNRKEHIGILKINVSGIDAIRHCMSES